MPALNDLAPELLHSICQELYTQGRPLLPLKSLSLVCRKFHRAATRLLFQHVVIDFTAKDPGRCALFLGFIIAHPHIKSHIKSVVLPVRRYGWHANHPQLENALVSLLPALPRLQRITLGDDRCLNYDEIDLRSIPLAIMEAIIGLPQAISLDVNCYVHTLNSQLDFTKVFCLESLRVCMVNVPHFSNHTGLSNHTFDGNVSADVAEIIHKNPHMRALHLCLQTGSGRFSQHESYHEVREQALEYIGREPPQLDSLTLEGDFHFTEAAWKRWNANCRWNHLRSLSISNMPLIENVTCQLKGCLPSLRKLKISAYESLTSFPHNDFHQGVDSVKKFFAGLSLTHLSMLGFHPNVLLDAVQATGSTLNNIRFHVREDPTDLFIVRGPNFSELLLSAAHVTILQSRCTNLSWLGLDVTRSSLQGSALTVPHGTVQSGFAGFRAELSIAARDPGPTLFLSQGPQPSIVPCGPPSYGDAASTSRNSVLNSSPWRRHPRIGQESSIPAVSVLDDIANIPSLRHVRLFVHRDRRDPWSLSNADSMATFSRLRSAKRGNCLESMTICAKRSGDAGLWIIWELGPRMATLEYREDREFVRELWNTDDNLLQERKEGCYDELKSQPEWGIAEGW